VSPPLFSVVVSITVIIMCYVGGIGSIYGAAIAAILLTLLTEMLRGFGEYRLWIYTLTLMLILFFSQWPCRTAAQNDGALPMTALLEVQRRHQAFRRPHRREERNLQTGKR
jgi:hypothetical protein